MKSSKKINPLQLDQQLCFKLYSASRLMTQAYGPLLKSIGLTYPQYLVMLVLWETPSISVKLLGERLLLDSGTLSPLLKKLQEKGFVLKSRQHDDERVVEISLTLKGQHLQKKAVKIPHEMLCKLSMKNDEFYELRSSLAQLVQVLSGDAII